MDTKTFRNRKELWKDRQKITEKGKYYKNDSTSFHNNSNGTYPFEDLTAGDVKPIYSITKEDASSANFDDSKYNSGYFQECNLQLLESFEICPKCKYPDPNVFDFVLDEENYILGKTCTKCNKCFIGVDDSHSIHDIEELLRRITAPLCRCGNNDIEKYILDEDEDEYFLRCTICFNKVNASPNCSTQSDSHDIQSLDNEIECPCGKKSIMDYHVQMDESASKVLSIHCSACSSIFNVQKSFDKLADLPKSALKEMHQTTSCEKATLKSIKKSKPVGKIMVQHASDIRRGNHICFWRTLRWEHHAIVKEVKPKENKIVVINYYPPNNKGPKAIVTETEICLDKNHPHSNIGGPAEGIIYVIKYDGPCFCPDKVVKQAEERLGETEYNFILANCEHFARACTTGFYGFFGSTQVFDLAKSLYSLGHRISTIVTKDLLKTGLMRSLKSGAVYAGADIAADTVSSGALGGVSEQCAHLCSPVGIGLTIAGVAIVSAFEIYGTHKHIKKMKEQLKEGKCDQPTYENEKCGSIAKCVFKIAGISGIGIAGNIAGGAIAGAAGLGAIGNFVCPIVGGLIGATLGSLLGFAIGSAIKFGHAQYQKHKAQKHHSEKK